jgi:hypothetical protein
MTRQLDTNGCPTDPPLEIPRGRDHLAAHDLERGDPVDAHCHTPWSPTMIILIKLPTPTR